MFISVLELFKIGIGPSSSHTLGPLVAAGRFLEQVSAVKASDSTNSSMRAEVILKGSLAFTGKGHGTDRAVTLGLHGYTAATLVDKDVGAVYDSLRNDQTIESEHAGTFNFNPDTDIIFDRTAPLPQHPNGMIFAMKDAEGRIIHTETYFSIGGGFIDSIDEISDLKAPIKVDLVSDCTYPFDSAKGLLELSEKADISIAAVKRVNEHDHMSAANLESGMDAIWDAMQSCTRRGLQTAGTLPGGLNIERRAKKIHDELVASPEQAGMNDWLCAYAMAVNEENAAGNMVVTAPTNGAAGVLPAVLYYFVHHENGSREQVHDFLLTAAAIGGIIKLRSSISGAEVGCQGEVGSAAAMTAAGLCAVKGGSSKQIENAAEIALEHHLGMTCDPVNGLVQVPCIERNGFGAIKAYTAASLALKGSGDHFMPLDSCIEAMRQTGQEMSVKYKETSLGGLAVSLTEC